MMTPTPKWIQLYQPNPQASLRVFCFPYAGAGAQIFRDWARHLPAFVEVCPILLPGRWARMREPLLTDMDELICGLDDGLSGWLDKRFALFGASLGANAAFELARLLQGRSGPQPCLLGVASCAAPHLRNERLRLHTLSDDELIEGVRDRYDGIPDQLLAEPELLRLTLPPLRADLTINETYKYVSGPPLACPIIAYSGEGDRIAPPDTVEAWSAHTTGSFKAELYDGEHFVVMTHTRQLLASFSAALAAAQASCPARPTPQ